MNMKDLMAEERRVNIAFANRLRSLRIANGHAIKTFADAIGISEENYRKFELAQCQPPLDALTEIKHFTSCDLDYLLSGQRFNEKQPSQQNFANKIALEDSLYPQPILSWYWETDTLHRVVVTCRPIEERSSPAGAIGMTMWEYNNVDLERNEHWHSHKKIIEAHKPFDNFVYRGHKEFLKASGKPIYDANMDFKGFRGYCAMASQEDLFKAIKSDHL